MSVAFVKGIERFRKAKGRPAVVTIGTFDGIHRGHQEILKRVLTVTDETGCEPVLVTFHPHPRVLVSPEKIPLLLTTIEEKEKFIPDFFSGTALVLEFNDALKELSPDEFVSGILVRTIGVKELIVGYDHAFGKNRSGNTAELSRLGKKYGFNVEVVGPVMFDGRPISSSRIRRAMLSGDYEKALQYLGHDYAIYGRVEKGIGLGRRLGYPTANIRFSQRKLLPPEGVYACRAQVGNESKHGMMFIGRNHFNPQGCISVEANLFDFDRDVYGEEMIVYPTHFIRKNRKFDSTSGLVEQIRRDEKSALEIVERETKNVGKQRAKSTNYC